MTIKTYPTSLKRITRDKEYINVIKEAVNTYNNIVILANQLFSLWTIKKFEEDDKTALQNINRLIMRYSLMISTGKCDVDISNQKNVKLTNEMKDLFNQYLMPIINDKWVVRESWMNQLNKYYDVTLFTNLEVNIKEHFKNRVAKYVNRTFEDVIQAETKKEKRTILNQIKKDMMQDTRDSDTQYHSWINLNREKIYPDSIDERGLDYDLEKNPLNYLYGTIYIAKQLESIENIKSFKAIPMRTSLINRFIKLDGEILSYMFKDYFDYKTSLMKKPENKREMFNKIFNMKVQEFQSRLGMKFDFIIQTDGISCRLMFKSKKLIDHEKENGKQRTKQRKISQKIERKQAKQDEKYVYLDKLSNKAKKPLKDKLVIGLDPGKTDLFTGSYKFNNTEQSFSYSAKQKRMDDYTTRLTHINNKLEKEFNIHEARALFSNSVEKDRNRYSIDLTKFGIYLTEYHKYAKQVETIYQKDIWNKLSWRGFIKKQQTKEKILKSFENQLPNKTFDNEGKIDNVVLCMGDWSSKSKVQLKNNKPTMGIGLLRLLKKRFTHLYLIDEYKTSRCCRKCYSDCENEITTDKILSYTKNNNPIYRKVHKILCCTNENCRIIWNRDINGSGNIEFKSKCILLNKDIPEQFKRGRNETPGTRVPSEGSFSLAKTNGGVVKSIVKPVVLNCA